MDQYSSMTRAQLIEEIERLRESERKLRDLFDNVPFAYQSLDGEGNFVACNEKWCETLGYQTEEVLGRNFSEFIHPDYREVFEENFPRFKGVGYILGVEFEMVKKDGSEILVSFDGKIGRAPDGSVRQTHCILQDITEKRESEAKLVESEERLRSVLDTSPFPVAVVDPNDDQIVFWSRSAHELFGHTAPTASEWYEIAYPDPEYRQEVIARWKPALDIARESGHTVNTGEYRVRCSDGSERICELFATFLPENLIVTFDDVTERRRLEAALRNSRDSLRGLAGEMERVREEERTNLARELHDEVGQALTALKMDLESMGNEFTPGPEDFAAHLQSMIDIAQDSVQRVNRMSAELRSPILYVLGLPDAVESEVWEYQERRGLDVGLEMDIPPLARSRERDLAVYRILQESLSNVRRHAQASRTSVRLKAVGPRLVLEVADDGIGITTQQLSDPRSFGLIGMRERAGRFGGKVEIRRRKEGGTLVRAEIPIGSPAEPKGMVQ